MKSLFLPIALSAALVGCAPAAEVPAPEAPAEVVELDPVVEPEVAGTAGELDVMFELGFTEYALMRLAELGETVTVSGMYYGEPVPEVAAAMTEAEGPVYVIGTFETTLDPVNQTVTVSGAGIDSAKLANLVAGPKLNVNIFSARTKHPDNLIECTLVDGEVGELRAKPPASLCEMLDAN
jgi:hypothetical protein